MASDKKIILIAGYGPGIAHAVAERFGREGFEVALVARTEGRLKEAVAALSAAGITAHAFPCDLSDPAATRALVETVGAKVAPITIYHWNALASVGSDVLGSSVAELQAGFNVGITSFVAGLAPAVAQMKGAEGAAVLVTGGGFGAYDDAVDGFVAQLNVLGLAATKAAQHKLARTLSRKLAADGIFVGEVVVTQMVKGTAFDAGNATLDARDVGEAFWKLYSERAAPSVAI